jgi:hypothetical protein
VELMGELAAAGGGVAPPVEERVILLLTLERVADAIADGEAMELGADRLTIITSLIRRVVAYLTGVTRSASTP